MLAFIALVVLFFLYLGLCVVFNGWVLSKLWLWLIVPSFHVTPLGIAQAMGLALVVRFMTSEADASTNSILAKKDAKTAVLLPFSYGLVALTIGFILKHFI